MVRENANGTRILQNLQRDARRFIFEDWLIPRQAAIPVHQRIDPAILDGPCHVMKRETVECMREGGKLPCAKVSGQVEHAFAAALAFEKVFMAVQDDDLFDILFRVFRKARKLGSHPAHIAEHSANDRFELSLTPIREGNA